MSALNRNQRSGRFNGCGQRAGKLSLAARGRMLRVADFLRWRRRLATETASGRAPPDGVDLDLRYSMLSSGCAPPFESILRREVASTSSSTWDVTITRRPVLLRRCGNAISWWRPSASDDVAEDFSGLVFVERVGNNLAGRAPRAEDALVASTVETATPDPPRANADAVFAWWCDWRLVTAYRARGRDRVGIAFSAHRTFARPIVCGRRIEERVAVQSTRVRRPSRLNAASLRRAGPGMAARAH